jgi:hypothetical protein
LKWESCMFHFILLYFLAVCFCLVGSYMGSTDVVITETFLDGKWGHQDRNIHEEITVVFLLPSRTYFLDFLKIRLKYFQKQIFLLSNKLPCNQCCTGKEHRLPSQRSEWLDEKNMQRWKKSEGMIAGRA